MDIIELETGRFCGERWAQTQAAAKRTVRNPLVGADAVIAKDAGATPEVDAAG